MSSRDTGSKGSSSSKLCASVKFVFWITITFLLIINCMVVFGRNDLLSWVALVPLVLLIKLIRQKFSMYWSCSWSSPKYEFGLARFVPNNLRSHLIWPSAPIAHLHMPIWPSPLSTIWPFTHNPYKAKRYRSAESFGMRRRGRWRFNIRRFVGNSYALLCIVVKIAQRVSQ